MRDIELLAISASVCSRSQPMPNLSGMTFSCLGERVFRMTKDHFKARAHRLGRAKSYR